MVQARINSLYSVFPDWIYFRFTRHGRELQSYLDIVHGFTRKVKNIQANRPFFFFLKLNVHYLIGDAY